MSVFYSKITFITLCILLLSGAARATSLDDIQFSDDMWEPGFVKILDSAPTHLSKDLSFSIPPFPANSTPETAKEIDLLLQYQETMRTPEQLEAVKIEVSTFVKTMKFGLETFVSPDVQKRVKGLIDIANHDLSYFLFREKRRFKRARPTQLSSTLKAGIPIPGHASYPSGHAMQARVFAHVYGYIDSAQASTYLQRSDAAALRREIFGLHYPSDSQAGKDMADQFFAALIKVDSVRQELDDVKNLYELDKKDASSKKKST